MPATLAAVAVLAGGAVWGVFQASRPTVEGSLTLGALEGPATVVRDAHGIPTLTAGTTRDAYALLGFVHAQDRFLQMEMMRRLGAGRLAEVIGERGVGIDRWSRTLGLYRRANAAVAGLDDATQEALAAYADGVNAWLAESGQVLPPALLALGVAPEPWRPADSLVWQRLMALRLAGNWPDELLRARLLERLPPDRVAALWPEDDDATPVTLPVPLREAALPPAPPAEFAPTLASNVWSLAPHRSATGGAILANDPHLGFEAPILWYLATVRTPDWELAGATVPGVPFHLIGRNAGLGWGITTTHADTMDLFVETLADDSRTYLTPSGPRPFETRDELIKVRGGEPVALTVRETRHGPVVSDLAAFAGAGAPGQVTALAATALRPRDRTPDALYRLNHAADAAAAHEALRLFEAPMQNVFFADTAGATGFVSAGLVPVRRAGDGTLPVPGADGSHDWTGFVPYDDLPQATTPPAGVLMNANNRVVPEDYPHLIAAEWPAPWRAVRAEALLARKDRHGLSDSAAMQVDALSTAAQALLPRMLAALPAESAPSQARALLAGWDFRERAERPEPLLFALWLREAERAVFADDLGPAFDDWDGEREQAMLAALAGDASWCDDRGTEGAIESCGALLGAALDRAVAAGSARWGEDLRSWRWGDAHRAAFVNRIYGMLPVVGDFANRRPPLDGGNHTLLRAGWRSGEGLAFDAVHGAGLRMVLDMAQPDRSRFVIATGQSENPLSPHYDDQMMLWLKGELLELDGEPVSVLRLNHDD